MDLAWGSQPIANVWGALLAVLPWIVALLMVAVLILWLVAAALVCRECRRLSRPRRKAAAHAAEAPPETQQSAGEDVRPSALMLRVAGPE